MAPSCPVVDVPFGHGVQTVLFDPFANVSSGHSCMLVLPLVLVKVPGHELGQDGAPGFGLYVPGLHKGHDVEPGLAL